MPFDGVPSDDLAPPSVLRAAHWSQVAGWRWPNFTPDEFACRGSGSLFIVADLLDALQATRAAIGRPMRINSGYRSPAHNRRVGGAKRSYHVRGMAADVAIAGLDPDQVVAAARAFGIGGVGLYRTFRHFDIGPRRAWDRR